jgi:sugar O-acyltransferase (sialic acid O-acetyltransferase NeuD family)
LSIKNLVIIGKGGLGREIEQLVYEMNREFPQWNFLGFYDDYSLDEDVLGKLADLNTIQDSMYYVFAIGDAKLKSHLANKVHNPNLIPATLIHPSVQIRTSQRIQIGNGTVIQAGVRLTCDIVIEDHVLINLNTTIGHDSKIMSFSSIMPGVNISGNVKIGEAVYVGTGATFINNCQVGSYSVIGAGAVVIESIPDYTTAVGIPAKGITKN